MPIIVHKLYVGQDLARSQENGYQLNVKAEASITVIPKASTTEFPYAGLRIVEKKDGSGLTVVPPSQRETAADGTTKYIDLYSIPKPWGEGVKAKVLEEYAKWEESGRSAPAPKDDFSDLQDPFAEL